MSSCPKGLWFTQGWVKLWGLIATAKLWRSKITWEPGLWDSRGRLSWLGQWKCEVWPTLGSTIPWHRALDFIRREWDEHGHSLRPAETRARCWGLEVNDSVVLSPVTQRDYYLYRDGQACFVNDDPVWSGASSSSAKIFHHHGLYAANVSLTKWTPCKQLVRYFIRATEKANKTGDSPDLEIQLTPRTRNNIGICAFCMVN